ncbi:MAG: peptidylprolyl isomerase [archaeon]|jgi:peptidylprolyl isomerase
MDVVKNGDQIAVNYTGRLENGSIFDTSVGKSPLEFTAGAGQMIKGFDSAVIGMKVGETKTVKLSPEEAYGALNPKVIFTLNKSAFPDFDKLKEGMQMQTSSGACGRITKKTETEATVDFNHELAGKTLIFEITVVSIN